MDNDTVLLLTLHPKKRGQFAYACGSENMWYGVTVCNQPEADENIPILLSIPAVVRFLSIEPMLGKIDITQWLYLVAPSTAGPWRNWKGETVYHCAGIGGQMISHMPSGDIGQVIVGCESGPRRRPSPHEWIQSIVDQCRDAGVPCYVRQISEHPDGTGKVLHNIEDFPSSLRVKQFPPQAEKGE